MRGKYRVEEFIYDDLWDRPLGELYQAVSKKYRHGIYWSYDPRSKEGKHVFLCFDKENNLIGKGHAMILEKQEEDAPSYAKHRIFLHYRVLPEYEKEEDVLDLLYETVYQCAQELKMQLSNRVCQVCVGNFDFENIYNQHIEKKGWPEHGSIYHLSAKTRVSDPTINELDEIILREFTLDSMEIICQLVMNDQICFRDCIASADNYLNIAKGNYLAYGAFIKNQEGSEKLVGSVVTEIEENQLPEYRRKHFASNMIQYVMDALHKKGYKKAWLVTQCVNKEAIEMYQKQGFSIYTHEKRYMKYL